MAGASVTEIAELFGVLRSTVLRVMSAFNRREKHLFLSKTPEKKGKIFRKRPSVTNMYYETKSSNCSSQISTELNDHLENPVSTKTVCRELH